jgi:hypothetical protein
MTLESSVAAPEAARPSQSLPLITDVCTICSLTSQEIRGSSALFAILENQGCLPKCPKMAVAADENDEDWPQTTKLTNFPGT